MAYKNRQDEYLICPLPLMADLIADGEALSRIFDCGLVHRAIKMRYSEEKVKRQLILDFFCEYDNLPDSFINSYFRGWNQKECSREDFDNGTVEPDDYMEFLNKSIRKVAKTDLPSDIILWYLCRMMLDSCNLKSGYLPTMIKKAYDWIYSDTLNSKFNGIPTFLLNAEVAFDLYNQRKSMSEERRAFWAYYLAIMSILGTKSWASTTSQMIKARLAGANSTKDLGAKLEAMTPMQKVLYDKYTTRRFYEKIMSELQTEHMFVEYGANRHTYLSTKLTLRQLISEVMTKTGAEKQRRLQDDKRNAKAEILAKLRAERSGALPPSDENCQSIF